MFPDFAKVWSIVGSADDVPNDKLLQRTVAGERVVLFRDASGQVCALLDRCPHRGVALSLGKLKGGTVECPFHGWRFDGAGRNCGVPWNPDAKTEQLSAIAIPVREHAGLLWLFTGRDPPSEPYVSPSLLESDIKLCTQSTLWQCHWTRAMENMLDMPHLPFVHRRTIGKPMAQAGTGRMEVDWTETDYGAELLGTIEGRTRQTRLTYLRPNAMELVIDPPGKTLRIIAVCLPETATRTRMIFASLRSFAKWRALDPLFRWSNRRIAAEDKAVLESSQPVEVPPPREERSVRTDLPTLAFRKFYFERLKDSSA